MNKGKRPSLLIIDKEQFGHMTDPYKWCEYLRDKYEITFLTAALGKEQVTMDGVRIIYVTFNVPFVLRGILFILAAIWQIYKNNGVTIIEYFKYCSVLRLLCPFKKLIVDVRTLSVAPDTKSRDGADTRLFKDCKKFKNIAVISEGVREKIGLFEAEILPLGSDVVSAGSKEYDDMHILYIGTFNNRNIDTMIRGLAIFYSRHKNISMTIDIVGDGKPGQLDEYKKLAYSLGLDPVIKFHGFLPLTSVKPFFDRCNVGMSFIPMTPYFDHQPPTKTFEYILSGLYCVATATTENGKLINESNGVIIDDTEMGVVEGLETYMERRHLLSDKTIRESLLDCQWERIVNDRLVTIIEKAKV